MRETSTQGPSIELCDDDDAVSAAPFVVAGLVLLLPLVLFALGAVVVDVVAGANVAVDVFAALALSSLFGLGLRALPTAPDAR